MTVTYEGATGQAKEIVHHHAVLRRSLEQRVGVLCAAAGDGAAGERALVALQEYLAGEILPHAEAEERALYRAATTQARGSRLVRTLTAEHRELAGLAGRLQPGMNSTTAATVAEWIATLFAGHAAKENDLLLPALTGSGTDLAALLADMHGAATGARA
ncbi:MAG TPA: hemerythrin domain-containing protein [Streptosporangiaceae bacterium]|nr:hemerythrin domain-containing protein [Streptosporangiaceae bacterium]